MRTPSHQFLVRMPFDLCEWLEARAAENCRSKNQEIIFRLKAAMAAEHAPVSTGGAATAGEPARA